MMLRRRFELTSKKSGTYTPDRSGCASRAHGTRLPKRPCEANAQLKETCHAVRRGEKSLDERSDGGFCRREDSRIQPWSSLRKWDLRGGALLHDASGPRGVPSSRSHPQALRRSKDLSDGDSDSDRVRFLPASDRVVAATAPGGAFLCRRWVERPGPDA